MSFNCVRREDLRTPIVPVVFFGGFDLWPVGTWINNTGHVTIRYLKPIQPSEAENRDDMMTLVRSFDSSSILVHFYSIYSNILYR